MFKRLAARGKTPPPPVASPAATSNAAESFDIEQKNEGEGATPVSPSSTFVVTVYSLDDDQKPLDINVQRDSDGQWLFDEVCEQLGGLQEKDYFGLRFLDREKQRQWVDPARNIYRQLKHIHPCCVSFRVKHYPPSPLEDLKQEISKYFLYLQIKRDIVHSRLLCQGSEAYELAAYIAQADLGDYEDIDDPETYLSEFKVLPNQSPKSETKIAEIHKTLTGILPIEAEAKCLSLASKLETYGIDPYSVKDQKGNVLFLGLTHVGVVTFQGSRRAHVFKWSDITKFNYDGKLFIIHVTFREDNQFKRKSWLDRITKKHILGFKCESRAAALSLWRWAVDRYCFFTLKRSSEAKRSKSGGGLFRRSHTFRFSGRCQKEVLTSSVSLLTLPQPVFTRTSSLRREERSRMDNADEKFATYPRSKRNELSDIVTMPRPTDHTDCGEDKRSSLLDKVSELPAVPETPTADKKTPESDADPSADAQVCPDGSAPTHSLPAVIITEADESPCDQGDWVLQENASDATEAQEAQEKEEEQVEEEEEDEKTVTEDLETLEESDSGVEAMTADTETSSCTLADSRAEACILDEDSEDADDLVERIDAVPMALHSLEETGIACETKSDLKEIEEIEEAEEEEEEEEEKEVVEEDVEKVVETVIETVPATVINDSEKTKTELPVHHTVGAMTEIIVESEKDSAEIVAFEEKPNTGDASAATTEITIETVRVSSPHVKNEECEETEEGNETKEVEEEGMQELLVEEEKQHTEEVVGKEEEVDDETEEEEEELEEETEETEEKEEEATMEKANEDEEEGKESVMVPVMAEEEERERNEKQGEEEEEIVERKEEEEKQEEEMLEKSEEQKEEQNKEEEEEEKEAEEVQVVVEEKEEECRSAAFESQGPMADGGGVGSEPSEQSAVARRDDAAAATDVAEATAAAEAVEPSAPVSLAEAGPPESDGGIVETIIVPSLAAPAAACPNGPSERGVDVGDGDQFLPEPIKPQASSQPLEEARPSSPECHLDSNGKFVEVSAAQSPPAAPASPAASAAPSKGSRWRRCASGLALLLLFSGATLVLLFELGPSWPPTRSLLDGAVLDDWRQQWYLPLRSRILPGPPQ